jgi:hypothetical protein
MKLSEFKKQIKENIVEILSEDAYELEGNNGKSITSFKTSADATKFKTQNPNVKSLKKLEEINPPSPEYMRGYGDGYTDGYFDGYEGNEKVVHLTEEDELEEMARQEKFFAISNPEAAKEIIEKYGHKWVGKVVAKVMDSGEGGITQPALAKEFGVQQPSINPIFRKMLEAGVFTIINSDAPTGKQHSTHSSKNNPKQPSSDQTFTPEKPASKPVSAHITKSDDDDAPEVKDTWNKPDDDDKPSTAEKPNYNTKTGTKLASTKDKYNELIKKMKEVADKYKKASGDESKELVNTLKDLTKEKKKLEAILNPSIDDEDDI